MEIAARRALSERWALWQQVMALGIVPGALELATMVVDQTVHAERLMIELILPGLGADFGAQLATPTTHAAEVARRELARMTSASHRLATGLHGLHSSDPMHGEAAARGAIWLTLAAAVVDQKIDDRVITIDEIRTRLNPTAFLGAIAGGPPIAVPSQPLLEILLANTVAAFAARIAISSTDFDRLIEAELSVCIRDMIVGQLDSPRLRIHPLSDLTEVELTLRRVNTLTTWIPAYLGLFGAKRLADDTVRAVRHITTRVGEIGWALDALSDIHVDLEAGVWSLVWLELARETGQHAPWLQRFVDQPGVALDALARSSVIARMLAKIAMAIDDIRRTPHVDANASAQLAAFCSYMVWSFLLAGPPDAP